MSPCCTRCSCHAPAQLPHPSSAAAPHQAAFAAHACRRLHGCLHITDWGLKQLAAERPPLHTFALEWCGGGVYLDGLRALIRSCPLLEAFSVSSGQESFSLGSVTDELVRELVACCPRIAALELSDTRVGDAGLAAIAAANGRQLQSLQLNYTRAWGQWGVLALAQHCKALQFFSAASSAITDDALSLLGGGCPALAFVCVDRCRQVSLDGIMRLVNRGLAVQYVEMAGVFGRSSAEQRAVFGAWVQRRGMQYDARSGLLAPLQAA